MKLSFPVMDESINEFFSSVVASDLRTRIAPMAPREREEAVLAVVREEIKKIGGIPFTFRFRSSEGGGTSHHLVFTSKEPKGVGIMKRLMAKVSSEQFDGVGNFEFDPKSRGGFNLPLFSPLVSVADHLLESYAGQTLSFSDLVKHEAAEPHTDTNLRDAVLLLEEEFRIDVDPPATLRRKQSGGTKRTLPGNTILRFPK